MLFAVIGSAQAMEPQPSSMLCGDPDRVADGLLARGEYPIFSGRSQRGEDQSGMALFFNDIEGTYTLIERRGDQYCVVSTGGGWKIGTSAIGFRD